MTKPDRWASLWEQVLSTPPSEKSQGAPCTQYLQPCIQRGEREMRRTPICDANVKAAELFNPQKLCLPLSQVTSRGCNSQMMV